MPKQAKIEKIFFLVPPLRYYPTNPRSLMPPLGVMYLASMLRDEFDVRILDATVEGFNNITRFDKRTLTFGLSINDILKRIADFNPEVVGITCQFSINFPVVSYIARQIKSKFPGIKVILGGFHPTYLAEDILQNNKDIDFIILGEGENSFKNLILAIQGENNFTKIDGIAFRDNEKIIINKKTEYIKNLDELPYPSWDLVPMDLYEDKCIFNLFCSNKRGKHASISASRGCPFKCHYCATTNYWGNNYRQRGIQNVIKEMEYLIRNYGVNSFSFVGDNFFLNRSERIEFLKCLKSQNWDIAWYPLNGLGVWSLDEEVIKLMKETGASFIPIASESYTTKMIDKYIKKPIDLDRDHKVINLLNKYKINYYMQIILGFPGETKETINETINYIKSLKPSFVIFFMASAFPGTKLYEECKNTNCLTSDFDFTNLSWDVSYIKTEDFVTPKEMARYVHRKQIINNLLFIIRSPFNFFTKYLIRFNRPVIWIDFLRVHWYRIFGLK